MLRGLSGRDVGDRAVGELEPLRAIAPLVDVRSPASQHAAGEAEGVAPLVDLVVGTSEVTLVRPRGPVAEGVVEGHRLPQQATELLAPDPLGSRHRFRGRLDHGAVGEDRRFVHRAAQIELAPLGFPRRTIGGEQRLGIRGSTAVDREREAVAVVVDVGLEARARPEPRRREVVPGAAEGGDLAAVVVDELRILEPVEVLVGLFAEGRRAEEREVEPAVVEGPFEAGGDHRVVLAVVRAKLEFFGRAEGVQPQALRSAPAEVAVEVRQPLLRRKQDALQVLVERTVGEKRVRIALGIAKAALLQEHRGVGRVTGA